MKALKLITRTTPEAGLDLSVLLPEKIRAMKHSDIASIKLRHGVDEATVGDFFKVQGRATYGVLTIEGGSKYFHGLGANLDSGFIELFGDAGDDCGLGMSGGRLEIHGNCGDFVASGMSAGTCIVEGDCGDDCAAIRPGGISAICGGLLQIRGRCGARAGAMMTGGTMVVEGKSGSDLAVDMKAGTILALGGCGSGAARRMKRGTLIVNKKGMHPSAPFAHNGVFDLAVLRVIMRDLGNRAKGLHFLAKCPILVHRYTGDLSVDGVGEVLVPLQDITPN